MLSDSKKYRLCQTLPTASLFIMTGFPISGIRELEAVSPSEVDRAARLFHRDGFVVVKNVLTKDQSKNLREACQV